MSDSHRPKESTFTRRISQIALLFSALIPPLYLVGYYYESGYLSVFGLDNDFFLKTNYQYFINSFLLFSEWFIDIYGWTKNEVATIALLFLAYYVLFFIVTLVLQRLRYINYKSRRKIRKIKKNRKLQSFIIPIIPVSVIFGVSIIGIYIIFFIIALPYLAMYSGEEHANNIRNNIKTCHLKKLTPIEKCTAIVSNEKIVASGVWIAKSPTNIALWDGTKTIVYPLTNEIIEIRFGQNKNKAEHSK